MATGRIIQLVMIDDFLIDCSISESHEFESDITDDPVESGSNTSDNILPKPIVITMECIVSNTPIGDLAAGGVSARNPVSDPVDDAYEHLQKIRNAREPVTIRTSLRTFPNMGLKSLSVPRATGRGDNLQFTASFKEVIIVSNKRGQRVRTAIPQGHGGKRLDKPVVTLGKAPGVGVDGAVQTSFSVTSAAGFGGDKGNAFNEGNYIWFDNAISGWRYGVIQPDPDSVGIADGLVSTSTLEEIRNRYAYNQIHSQWRFRRGRIVGYSFAEWVGRDRSKTNADHKAAIIDDVKANGENTKFNPGFKHETAPDGHTVNVTTFKKVFVVKGVMLPG